jgi:hypothetical protein
MDMSRLIEHRQQFPVGGPAVTEGMVGSGEQSPNAALKRS